MIMHYNTTH